MFEEKKVQFSEIKEIANKISHIRGVKGVYLFGSYVSGQTHRHSDIDLCVICDESEKVKDKVLSYHFGNVEISFFSRLPLTLRYRIFKEGKPLVINDKIFVDRLKIYTLKEYLDMKYFIDRFIKERFQCMT